MSIVHNIISEQLSVGDKTLTLEHGKFASQAQGAVMVQFGEVRILATTGVGSARDGIDFLPLVVEFEPRFYATGKMKHSPVNKREGRKSDHDILTSRVIDRSLRPLLPKSLRNEVQVVCTLLQADGETPCPAAAITGASVATLLTGLPLEAAVGAVQIGMDDQGEFIISPTFAQAEEGKLDLLVAGTEEAILMVEAGANLIDNATMIKALTLAHAEIKKICAMQKKLLSQFTIDEYPITLQESNETAQEAVDKVISDSDLQAVSGATKHEIKTQMHALEDKLLAAYQDEIAADTLSSKDLSQFLNKKLSAHLRQRVFATGKRVDGRDIDQVRDIFVEAGPLSRLHGSAIFQRGETQVLSTVTVAGPDMKLLISDSERAEYRSNYFHHYNFPPFSVGEVRPMRGPGRREIGHGALAERALQYVLPEIEKDNWMYSVRVVSEVLSCNGSSSMASVCGSSLALMDAGVPIKTVVAGVAMGLLLNEETGDYRLLTDIQGLEDFDGDMDFKVAGDENGITCLQLDIKVKGLKLSLLEEALEQSQIARQHILSAMKKVLPAPRAEMNQYAPQIAVVEVDKDDVRSIIGKGGEVIQGMCADFDVEISIEDDSRVCITGQAEGIRATKEKIAAITYKAVAGDVFEEAEVKTITDFGAFVQYAPGKDGLLHISEIAKERVNKVEDYLKVGQKVRVKIIEVDRMGKVRLSMKR